MKKLFSFKKRNNKIISTTTEDKPKALLNVLQAHERIQELEAQLGQDKAESPSPAPLVSENQTEWQTEEQAVQFLNESIARGEKAKAESKTPKPELKYVDGRTPAQKESARQQVQAYMDMAKKSQTTDGAEQTLIERTGVATATSAPWFFADKGFYLLFENGRAYLQVVKSAGDKKRFPVLLVHSASGTASPTSVAEPKFVRDHTEGKWVPYSYQHLTRAEVDQIVKDKPSLLTVTSIYEQVSNNTLRMDHAKAVVVFG